MSVGQKGPLASQRSTCGNRSWPRNGSPSTKMYGAPNTPRAIASPTCALSFSLMAVSCVAACSAAASCTGRLYFAASASNDCSAIYEYGDAKSKKNSIDAAIDDLRGSSPPPGAGEGRGKGE